MSDKTSTQVAAAKQPANAKDHELDAAVGGAVCYGVSVLAYARPETESRESLEAAGLEVVVAAATTE